MGSISQRSLQTSAEGGGAGKGKGKAKQTMGRVKGGKDAQVCKQTKGSSKGIGTKAAAFGAASVAKAPPETAGASARKNPERGRQSLGKCVNFFCELLDHTPRSTQAAPCGNVRGCVCCTYSVLSALRLLCVSCLILCVSVLAGGHCARSMAALKEGVATVKAEL